MSERSPRRSATLDLLGRVVGLRAELVSTKRVEAGLAVSYGGEYRTSRETTLALVSAGYADGVPRSAQGNPVTIDGIEYPIVGRVAMDQFVIDVGDATPSPGSTVVLWGEGGVSPAAWAERAALPEDALTGFLGPRVEAVIEDTVATSDEMERLGERIGSIVGVGDAVILSGELGAGKTTLTRGIGRALGVRGTVQSPTFVIARSHKGAAAPLLHVDAYRLGDAAELDDLDLDLEGSVTVAEWGEPLVHALPSYLRVRIERSLGGFGDGAFGPDDFELDDPRRIRITGVGDAWPAERIYRITTAGDARQEAP